VVVCAHMQLLGAAGSPWVGKRQATEAR
jgi:hypothetical protein